MAVQAFKILRDALNGPQNNTILITGGGSGIGLHTALLLHQLGNNIVILDRAEPSSLSHEELIRSARILYQQCDVSSWNSQRAGFESGIHKFGSIDAVFINAGIGEHKDQLFSEEVDEDGLLKEPDRRTLDIDIHGASDTAKLAIHYIRNKPSGRTQGGSIVFAASLAGYLASTGAPLYSAAKHGVVGLVRALKNDTARLGIAVSLVAPAITLTDIIEGRQQGESVQDWGKRMRGLGVPVNEPEEVANYVVFLISQGMKSNGQGLLVQGGQAVDLETGITVSRKSWMGEQMLAMFRAGRNIPLFASRL